MSEKVQYMFLGIIFLLIVKYVIVGLREWNSLLHPDREENEVTMFAYPFLGILQPPIGTIKEGTA